MKISTKQSDFLGLFLIFFQGMQISIVLAIIIQSQVRNDQENLMIAIITPSFVMALIVVFFILKKWFIHLQNSLNLGCILLILTILIICDGQQKIYPFSTNMLYMLVMSKNVDIAKEIYIYMLISGVAIQIKQYIETKNLLQLNLVILSCILQVGIIIIQRVIDKQPPLNVDYIMQSPRVLNVDKMIQKFQWLDGSDAVLYDSNMHILHYFQTYKNKTKRMLQTSLIFQCNNQLMDLNELLSQISIQIDYLTHPFQQFLNHDNKVIVNIIIELCEDHMFFIVHYQDIPTLYNKQNSLLDVSSSISHELSSHLNCIITIAQLCYDDSQINTTLKDETIEPILTNSQQLELIVNNLRDYNYIQSNSFMSQIQQFSIVSEIFQICELFRKVLEERKITLEFQFKIDSYLIESDKQRFRQIFYQLFQNAVRFSNNSTIIIVLKNEQNLIKVEIIDKGQGMNKEEQTTLKDILDMSKLIRVSAKSIGCSLGLYISNLLAKKIGDERAIDFESLQYIGSTFRFWLKDHQQKSAYKSISTIKRISLEQYQDSQLDNLIIAESVNEYNTLLSIQKRVTVFSSKCEREEEENVTFNLVEEEQRLQSKPPILKTKRITEKQFNLKPYIEQRHSCCAKVLIVDDEYFNIFALQAFMKQQKYMTDYAYDGQEALNKVRTKIKSPCIKCRSNSYQLIFLDINMPKMDGIQTVREIKNMVKEGQIPNVCCAANSAFSDLDTKQRSYDAGMDIYLTKPLNLPILRSLIHRVFQQEVFLNL